MSIGQIVQVIGAVVDVEFPRDAMPKVYDALILEQDENNTLAEAGLTFEVQQQLGDGVVRTIAMGSSWATAWCAPLPWARPKVCSAA